MKTLIDPHLHRAPPDKVQNQPSKAAAKEACKVLCEAHIGDIYDVTPSMTGWSGMQCFSVDMGNQQGHLKLSPPAKPLPVAPIAKEFHNAHWAADHGFAPEVLWSSVAKQGLLTKKIRDESNAAQGTRLWGPVSKSSIRALCQLHRSEQFPTKPFDHVAVTKEMNENFKDAKRSKRPCPFPLESAHTFAMQAIEQLKAYPVHQSLLHGDMNGVNNLYTKERVYLIDWGGMHVGDPMPELANFGAHLKMEMPQMRKLWWVYSGERSHHAKELRQLQLNLTLLHAKSYAMWVTGMPWQNPAFRDSELLKLARQLQDDAKALNLISAPPKQQGCLFA